MLLKQGRHRVLIKQTSGSLKKSLITTSFKAEIIRIHSLNIIASSKNSATNRTGKRRRRKAQSEKRSEKNQC